MSLLIDALRKAEQERDRSADQSGDLDALSLEPMSPPQDLAPREADPDQASRDAAANLFSVKQTSTGPGRLAWFALAGITAGITLAAYVWWQMQPSGLSATAPPSGSSIVATTRPVPAQPPQDNATSAPAGPAAFVPDEPVVPPPPPADTLRTRRGTLEDPVASATPAPTREAVREPRVIRTAPRQAKIPEMLARAYAAYSTGRFGEAAAAYRMHLQSDPNSSDALNGMGAIALESGRPEEAAAWFRRSIEANPDDPVAQAGLASAVPSAPVEDESRLRSLLSRAPDSPEAAFALGNALARQQRWAEAQQAYFSAHTGDPGNPDFLFNLAVSLDQLGQPALAQDFYRKALSAATARPAVFDPAPVRTRLAALEAARR
jgi:tetratricopeptide (TPR) repeat protein